MEPPKETTPKNPTPPPKIISSASESHNPLLVGVVILILFVAGGLAFLMFSLQSKQPTPTTQAVTPSDTPIPSIEPTVSMNSAVEEIVIEEVDADFEEIEKDLESL